MSIVAIVPAAGVGSRFGGSAKRDKLFTSLCGRPLLAHTLSALQAIPEIRWIIVATRKSSLRQIDQLLKRYRIRKALPVCEGGATRAETVAKAYHQIPKSARWVLVHDGARPCVSQKLIRSVMRSAKKFGAAVSATPAAMTIKRVDKNHRVSETLDRRQLRLVQTPQIFRREWFDKALISTNGRVKQSGKRRDDFPDDSAIVEQAGFIVHVVPGDSLNIKVTTQEDLILAEAILNHEKGKNQKGKVPRTSGGCPGLSPGEIAPRFLQGKITR